MDNNMKNKPLERKVSFSVVETFGAGGGRRVLRESVAVVSSLELNSRCRSGVRAVCRVDILNRNGDMENVELDCCLGLLLEAKFTGEKFTPSMTSFLSNLREELREGRDVTRMLLTKSASRKYGL